MRTSALYSTSQALRDAICDTTNQLVDTIERPIQLVEYITLPDIGQRTVLRFKLIESHFASPKEADVLESRMRTIAGPDYWVALTDYTHELSGEHLTQRLIDIDQAIPASILHYPPTQHSERIRQDANAVRHALNLAEEYLIWEIEVPISDTSAPVVIRIIDTGEVGTGLSTRQKPTSATIDDKQCHAVFLKHNPSYRGCLKAYLAAQQQRRTLNNFITQFETQQTDSGRPD